MAFAGLGWVPAGVMLVAVAVVGALFLLPGRAWRVDLREQRAESPRGVWVRVASVEVTFAEDLRVEATLEAPERRRLHASWAPEHAARILGALAEPALPATSTCEAPPTRIVSRVSRARAARAMALVLGLAAIPPLLTLGLWEIPWNLRIAPFCIPLGVAAASSVWLRASVFELRSEARRLLLRRGLFGSARSVAPTGVIVAADGMVLLGAYPVLLVGRDSDCDPVSFFGSLGIPVLALPPGWVARGAATGRKADRLA